MKELDKKIFIILLITILILIGFITLSYFKQKDTIKIFSKSGNEIVDSITMSSLNIIPKVYQSENISINYPYIEGASNLVNDKIKEFALANVGNINYEIKLNSSNLISIIFYGTVDNKNYSDVLNIDMSGNTIMASDIFNDKNEPIVILKSTYTSKYLKDLGSTLKLDYLKSISYTDLIDSSDIKTYFTNGGIGIIMSNIPSIIGYYINVEIPYTDLDNFILENEYNNIEVTEDTIRTFLTGGLISTVDRVGNVYPAGYVFTSSGNFSYNIGEINPTSNEELLSYRGNYYFEGNKLILHVIEEERVNNFNSEINYKKVVNKTDYVIEYNIAEFYKSYIVVNDYESIFYSLNIENVYLDKYRTLADAGY